MNEWKIQVCVFSVNQATGNSKHRHTETGNEQPTSVVLNYPYSRQYIIKFSLRITFRALLADVAAAFSAIYLSQSKHFIHKTYKRLLRFDVVDAYRTIQWAFRKFLLLFFQNKTPPPALDSQPSISCSQCWWMTMNWMKCTASSVFFFLPRGLPSEQQLSGGYKWPRASLFFHGERTPLFHRPADITSCG